MLVFAGLVKYEYKVRKIRIRKPDSEIDVYLRSMYRVGGSYKYACRMRYDPVKIDFGIEPSSKPKTLESVKKPAEDFEEDETDDTVDEQVEDTEDEVVGEGTDVYKEYIGKRVLYKSVGYGVARTCDGKYLGIEFESGPKAGKVTNYSLEACLSKGLIQIV